MASPIEANLLRKRPVLVQRGEAQPPHASRKTWPRNNCGCSSRRQARSAPAAPGPLTPKQQADLDQAKRVVVQDTVNRLQGQSGPLSEAQKQELAEAQGVLGNAGDPKQPSTVDSPDGQSVPQPPGAKPAPITDGGDVPPLQQGEKIIQSSKYWFFEHKGKKYVRFFAPEARSPNGAKKGGRGDGGGDNGSALLTPEGRIYVEEGQHRLNGVVLEGTTNMSSVPGHPKWLQFEFNGNTAILGYPPAYNTQNDSKPWVNENKQNPWDGEEGY